MIGGFILGVDAWSPSFHPLNMSDFSSLVWIRLPDLPLMFWDLKNIVRIATMVGQPLWVDGVTNALGRLNTLGFGLKF